MLYLLPEIQRFNGDRWCIVTVVGCAGHRTGTGVLGGYVVTGMGRAGHCTGTGVFGWCIVTVVGCAGHRTGTGGFGWYVVTGMLSTLSLPRRFCSVQIVSQLLNIDSDFCWWFGDGLWCTPTWPSHLTERWISSKTFWLLTRRAFYLLDTKRWPADDSDLQLCLSTCRSGYLTSLTGAYVCCGCVKVTAPHPTSCVTTATTDTTSSVQVSGVKELTVMLMLASSRTVVLIVEICKRPRHVKKQE